MSLSYQELIDRSVDQATRGLDPNTAPLIDAEIFAENLADNALQATAIKCAADPNRRNLLRQSQTVSFVNGVGVIANNVLLDYLCDSTLLDTTDLSKHYAYVPAWEDFVMTFEHRIGYYWASGTSIMVVEPAAEYVSGAGITSNLQLTTPTVPQIPVLATDLIAIPDVLVSDLIAELAAQIRGGA